MKSVLTSVALVALAGTLAFGGAASAQSRHDRHDDDRGRYSQQYRHDDRGRDYRGYDNRGRDYRDYRGYDDRGYNRHAGWHDRSDWRRGGYVAYDDWNRGYAVDYRRYHLRQPPYGYEWRRVNDNYVLAAIAGGLIASIIIGG